MKKLFFLGACLLALFATSCSNDDTDDNRKTITVKATIFDDTDPDPDMEETKVPLMTRMVYEKVEFGFNHNWSNNDSFVLYKGTNDKGSLFSNTAEMHDTFTGKDIEGVGKYYAVYGNNITKSGEVLNINFAEQVGTLDENGLSEFMLATADKLDNQTELVFTPMYHILMIYVKLPDDVTSDKVDAVIVSGLHNKATYNLNAADANEAYTYKDADLNDIIATNNSKGFAITSKKYIIAYVSIFPEKINGENGLKGFTITAVIGKDKYEEYEEFIHEEGQLDANAMSPVACYVHKVGA